MVISYAITVSDELKNFRDLLSRITSCMNSEDEIVILVDERKGCLEKIQDTCRNFRVALYSDTFEDDFADWKNNVSIHCVGDWIFQIDADELPTETLIRNLHNILESTDAEIIAVPRQNVVEGITDKDIIKWGWKETPNGINWPDYQWRIYKNCEYIIWKGRVHERPVSLKEFCKYSAIPETQFEYRLDHFKTIRKQRSQNAFYDTLLKSQYEEENIGSCRS